MQQLGIAHRRFLRVEPSDGDARAAKRDRYDAVVMRVGHGRTSTCSTTASPPVSRASLRSSAALRSAISSEAKRPATILVPCRLIATTVYGRAVRYDSSVLPRR